ERANIRGTGLAEQASRGLTMDRIRVPDYLAGNIEHVSRHWETKRSRAGEREAGHAPPVTIALARQAGTLGTSVAREVGQRLGWPVYDRELLQLIAREMGLRTSLLESVDERRVHWLQETLEGFSLAPGAGAGAYVHHLIQTILALGAHGECVIVGRGAGFILPAELTLRVRLVASLPDRIAALSERLKVSKEEAARTIDTTDRERARFVRDHFLKEPGDADNYDLVLNFTRFGVSGCADLIVEGVRRFQALAAARHSGTPRA